MIISDYWGFGIGALNAGLGVHSAATGSVWLAFVGAFVGGAIIAGTLMEIKYR